MINMWKRLIWNIFITLGESFLPYKIEIDHFLNIQNQYIFKYVGLSIQSSKMFDLTIWWVGHNHYSDDMNLVFVHSPSREDAILKLFAMNFFPLNDLYEMSILVDTPCELDAQKYVEFREQYKISHEIWKKTPDTEEYAFLHEIDGGDTVQRIMKHVPHSQIVEIVEEYTKIHPSLCRVVPVAEIYRA
jgi:hypothetical protein